MRHAESPMLTDIPDLHYRGIYAPDEPDYDDLTFSPEDDEKLSKASRWSRDLLANAKAGDAQALADLRTKLHITRLVTR